MGIAKVVGGVLAAVAGVFVVGGLVMSPDYQVERTMRIDAPPEVVFANVSDVEKVQAWSPWKAADPSMEVKLSDTKSGVGAWYSWKGDNSGEGRAEIIESVPNKTVRSKLDFVGMGSSVGYWKLAADGEGTKATWGFEGTDETPIMGPWLAMMMDNFVGADFDKGLKLLAPIAVADAKKRAEAEKKGKAAAAAFEDAAKGWKVLDGNPNADEAAKAFARALEEAAKKTAEKAAAE